MKALKELWSVKTLEKVVLLVVTAVVLSALLGWFGLGGLGVVGVAGVLLVLDVVVGWVRRDPAADLWASLVGLGFLALLGWLLTLVGPLVS